MSTAEGRDSAGPLTVRGVGVDLVLSSSLGFVAGGLTASALYALYPPARDHVWPICSLAVGSILLVLGMYLAARHIGAVRAGDALVVGYGLALVLAAVLVVTSELVHDFREHVPGYIGVKRVGLSHVEVLA